MASDTVGSMMSSGGGQTLPATLEQPAAATMLRLVITGSVDDGKSTLIGRLLYDSKQILTDQLEALRTASQRRNGEGGLDLSLLTDGLRAEREQGITIDVAYRYFQTAAPQVHHRRHPRPRELHPQHGHGRVDRRPGRDPDRRAQGRRRADPPARVHRIAARYQAPRRVRQQDGPGRLRGGALRARRAGVPRVLRPSRDDRRDVHPHLGGGRREHRRAVEAHALVPGPGVAVPPRARPHLLRPQSDRLPLSGAVGDPVEPRPIKLRRPRLPRLRRPDRRRRVPSRAIPWSCCPAGRRPGSPRWIPRTDRWRRPVRRCR